MCLIDKEKKMDTNTDAGSSNQTNQLLHLIGKVNASFKKSIEAKNYRPDSEKCELVMQIKNIVIDDLVACRNGGTSGSFSIGSKEFWKMAHYFCVQLIGKFRHKNPEMVTTMVAKLIDLNSYAKTENASDFVVNFILSLSRVSCPGWDLDIILRCESVMNSKYKKLSHFDSILSNVCSKYTTTPPSKKIFLKLVLIGNVLSKGPKKQFASLYSQLCQVKVPKNLHEWASEKNINWLPREESFDDIVKALNVKEDLQLELSIEKKLPTVSTAESETKVSKKRKMKNKLKKHKFRYRTKKGIEVRKLRKIRRKEQGLFKKKRLFTQDSTLKKVKEPKTSVKTAPAVSKEPPVLMETEDLKPDLDEDSDVEILEVHSPELNSDDNNDSDSEIDEASGDEEQLIPCDKKHYMFSNETDKSVTPKATPSERKQKVKEVPSISNPMSDSVDLMSQLYKPKPQPISFESTEDELKIIYNKQENSKKRNKTRKRGKKADLNSTVDSGTPEASSIKESGLSPKTTSVADSDSQEVSGLKLHLELDSTSEEENFKKARDEETETADDKKTDTNDDDSSLTNESLPKSPVFNLSNGLDYESSSVTPNEPKIVSIKPKKTPAKEDVREVIDISDHVGEELEVLTSSSETDQASPDVSVVGKPPITPKSKALKETDSSSVKESNPESKTTLEPIHPTPEKVADDVLDGELVIVSDEEEDVFEKPTEVEKSPVKSSEKKKSVVSSEKLVGNDVKHSPSKLLVMSATKSLFHQSPHSTEKQSKTTPKSAATPEKELEAEQINKSASPVLQRGRLSFGKKTPEKISDSPQSTPNSSSKKRKRNLENSPVVEVQKEASPALSVTSNASESSTSSRKLSRRSVNTISPSALPPKRITRAALSALLKSKENNEETPDKKRKIVPVASMVRVDTPVPSESRRSSIKLPPQEESSTPVRRSRRTSTSSVLEDSTAPVVVSSPAPRRSTRRTSISSIVEEEPTAPSTPVRRTRRTSISSVIEEEKATPSVISSPARRTRRTSITSIAEEEDLTKPSVVSSPARKAKRNSISTIVEEETTAESVASPAKRMAISAIAEEPLPYTSEVATPVRRARRTSTSSITAPLTPIRRSRRISGLKSVTEDK